jgi:hypothetical protein
MYGKLNCRENQTLISRWQQASNLLKLLPNLPRWGKR